MKKIELFFVAIATISILLILNVFPGGNEMFAISISVLSMLYFYGSFLLLNNIKLRGAFKKSSYDNIKTHQIVISILTGISISTLLTGILFKTLFLPGASEMLTIGISFSCIVTIVALVLKKTNHFNIKPILTRVIPIVILGSILLLNSRNDIIRFIYREFPDYAEAYIKFQDNPEDKEVEKAFMKENQKVYEPTNDDNN